MNLKGAGKPRPCDYGGNMQIGVSTATLYPMNTEDALLSLAELGIRNIEIFINCDTELNQPVRAELLGTVRAYSLDILAMHTMPWWEFFCLFSNYERRKAQFMDIYKRYFEFMNELGAGILVFHGANKNSSCSEKLYLERYDELIRLADTFGITIAQENVAYCKSGNLGFLTRMKRELGDRAKFTLDLKQAARSGYSAFEILEELGENIVHIHASDSKGEYGIHGDCLPIGHGSFDFAGFFRKLREINYSKGLILELYRENFSDSAELKESVHNLVNFYKNN
ncbi:MAG: sugar phosphate isomerase/epimerase [Oscillospiraceae bacterium]|jgi:sugar phosphate isomerase/epimerase|nr:sugar phosphate isomerase/epimerase [Oscillospiraceae bacterium]